MNGNKIPYFNLILIQSLQPSLADFPEVKITLNVCVKSLFRLRQILPIWLPQAPYIVAKKKNGPLSKGAELRARLSGLCNLRMLQILDCSFSPKTGIYLFNLSHLIGGDGFLCTDVRGDILRHPAKMQCLELVSAIAQMLTAGDMPSPKRAHLSSETFQRLDPPYARWNKIMMHCLL